MNMNYSYLSAISTNAKCLPMSPSFSPNRTNFEPPVCEPKGLGINIKGGIVSRTRYVSISLSGPCLLGIRPERHQEKMCPFVQYSCVRTPCALKHCWAWTTDPATPPRVHSSGRQVEISSCSAKWCLIDTGQEQVKEIKWTPVP